MKNNNNDMPPKIHNLVKLSKLAKLELDGEQLNLLDQINDFNLKVRYS